MVLPTASPPLPGTTKVLSVGLHPRVLDYSRMPEGVDEAAFTARIEAAHTALREPALQEVTRDLDRRWKAAITEVVREGMTAGEFHCPDPDGTALRLTALLDGLAVQLTSYPGAVSRSRAQEWVDEALARELGLGAETLSAQER